MSEDTIVELARLTREAERRAAARLWPESPIFKPADLHRQQPTESDR